MDFKVNVRLLCCLETKRVLLAHKLPSEYNGALLPLLLSRLMETRYFFFRIPFDPVTSPNKLHDFVFATPNVYLSTLSDQPKEYIDRVLFQVKCADIVDSIWQQVFFYIKGVRQTISGGLPDQDAIEFIKRDNTRSYLEMYQRVFELPQTEAIKECMFYSESYASEMMKTEEIKLTVIKEIQSARTIEDLLEVSRKIKNRLTVDTGWEGM